MNKLKIRLIEVKIHVISATGQHCVGNTICQQGFDAHSEIQFIQFFQKAIISVVAKFFYVVRQVIFRNHMTHRANLLHKIIGTLPLHFKTVSDSFQHNSFVSRLHTPKLRFLRMISSGMCIRYIKDILQSCFGAGIVQQGDAGGTSVYPPIHPLIPKFDGGASGGIGTLGMDQKLIPKRVLIDSGSSFQILLPVPTHSRQLLCFFAAELCD